MEAAFNCSTPTVPAEQALQERLDRIELRCQLLQELDSYLAACRRNVIEEQVEA